MSKEDFLETVFKNGSSDNTYIHIYIYIYIYYLVCHEKCEGKENFCI